jgi:hypothetical protein
MEMVPVILRIHKFLGAEKMMSGFEVAMARAATKRKLINTRANTTPSQSERVATSWESAPIDAKQKALRSIHPIEDIFEKMTIFRFKVYSIRKYIFCPAIVREVQKTAHLPTRFALSEPPKRQIIALLSSEHKWDNIGSLPCG